MTRRLDALVHERVMKQTPISHESHSWQDGYMWSETYYSTDIAAAWRVVEKIKNITPECEIVWDCTMKYWEVTWEYTEDRYARFASAETAPLAICIAALRAVGVSQDEIDAAMKQEVTQ